MNDVDIFDISVKGFNPVVDYENWSVAIFNDDTIWKQENINYLQKHDFTDEVFVLLKGQCTLIVSSEQIPVKMYGIKMQQGKVYNVKKGVWHSHVLGEDTKVLVVENSDTTAYNSPKTCVPYPIDLEKMNYIQEQTNERE